ncbi:MAG: radical SAM protein [Thaumarchaeota archaeon]|nr:MAG: radical SAM protein [Nitrososphaerota archaeon]
MAQTMKDIKPNATYSEARLPDLEWTKHRSPQYWEYRKNWAEYPKKMYAGNFPLNLDIETTNICNLLCPMCPRTIQIDNGTYVDIGTMGMDFYKKFIDEGAANGLCAVKLNFLGEPLLDRYIIERIKYTKSKGIIEVMFNTNATLLTEEMSHKLLEAGLDSIFFSVDSISRERFNKIRIGADYDTVVKNIINFVKIKNEGNYKHVQTRTSMVVMPSNKHEVEEFTKFWLPIVGIVGYGEWVEHTSTQGEIEDYNPDFVCSQPFQRMFIMYDGICTPCCVDDGRGYILGDLKKNTVTEIWHGERYQKLRNAMTNGRYKDIDICARCYVPYAKTTT